MEPPVSKWGVEAGRSVILIVGRPGSGKTVLAYRIGDEIRGKRPVLCPMSDRFKRPDYFKPFTGNFPDDSVIMVNDASLQFHARRFMSSSSVGMSAIQNIRRHRNIDLIWDVQNSGSVDIDILRATDCLCLKESSLLQVDYERPEMRKRYEAAEDTIQGRWKVSNAVVMTHRKKAFVVSDISPPSYWNEEISTDDSSRPVPFWRRLTL